MSNLAIMILGISLMFVATTAGSALVFFFKGQISSKLNTIILGFASGVMIFASVWCLLLPALEDASSYGALAPLPVCLGFMIGGLFLTAMDKIINYFHVKKVGVEVDPVKKKINELFLAVTLHNVAEGLAVGFAFGSAIHIATPESFFSALGLAIGISLQNFPEGVAISLPVKQQTASNSKAFLYGFFSGVVEPIFAVLGILLASQLTMLMPWFLSFAAGTMIFVVVRDLLPDAEIEKNPMLGTWGVMLGFVIMMLLDIIFG